MGRFWFRSTYVVRAVACGLRKRSVFLKYVRNSLAARASCASRWRLFRRVGRLFLRSFFVINLNCARTRYEMCLKFTYVTCLYIERVLFLPPLPSLSPNLICLGVATTGYPFNDHFRDDYHVHYLPSTAYLSFRSTLHTSACRSPIVPAIMHTCKPARLRKVQDKLDKIASKRCEDSKEHDPYHPRSHTTRFRLLPPPGSWWG